MIEIYLYIERDIDLFPHTPAPHINDLSNRSIVKSKPKENKEQTISKVIILTSYIFPSPTMVNTIIVQVFSKSLLAVVDLNFAY